jgi:predicted nucleic acid-binding protein
MSSATDPVALGLADTALFIAAEQDRPFVGTPPERITLSVITIAELRLGVLAAVDNATRARRLETLTAS